MQRREENFEGQKVEIENGRFGLIREVSGTDPDAQATIDLDGGGHRRVFTRELVPRPSGGYYLNAAAVASAGGSTSSERQVIPVVEETLSVQKRVEEVGRIAVRVRPGERTQVVEMPLEQETVEVQHVPVNRQVDSPSPTRQEGDVTIIPVYEERLVVEKRLFLKEEIRLTRVRRTSNEKQEVSLRTEEAQVVRIVDGKESPIEPATAAESSGSKAKQ